MALLTCHLYSSALTMNTELTVILPLDWRNDLRGKKLPAVYLLHGLTDDCTSWQRRTNIETYAERHGFAVIMPEVQRSFYTDMKFGIAYFTYITQELPQLCEQMFPLANTREGRFVAGLSMGGHGALKCALTFPEHYAACGAFSSAVDIKQLFKKGEGSLIQKEAPAIYGEKIDEQEDVFFLAKQAAESEKPLPKLFLSCGTLDSLYDNNERFYKHAAGLGYDIQGYEAPAGHEWPFWDESIRQALGFFENIRKEG